MWEDGGGGVTAEVVCVCVWSKITYVPKNNENQINKKKCEHI